MEKEKSKIKILLVEDDKFISRAYVDGLSRIGYQVRAAFDGKEGLLAMREEKPDIVLMDLIMPVKNGFETLEEAKADKDLKDIPIIILSNLGQDSDITKAKELGAVDYLIKSNFYIDEVAEKIKEHLKT